MWFGLLQSRRQLYDARFDTSFFARRFYDTGVAGFERVKSGVHHFFCGSVSE
jgi:hypothetical protein